MLCPTFKFMLKYMNAGYAFSLVSLFVSRIAEKVMDRFVQNGESGPTLAQMSNSELDSNHVQCYASSDIFTVFIENLRFC